MFRKLTIAIAAATLLGGSGLTIDSASAQIWRPHGGPSPGAHFAPHGFGGGVPRGFGGPSFGRGIGGPSFAFRRFGGPRFAVHGIGAPFGGVLGHAFGRYAFARPFGRYGLGHTFAPWRTAAAFAPAAAWRGGPMWDHRHGWVGWQGYRRGFVGWAGPVFWPYAYSDLFDYAFDPYDGGDEGDLFWAYGYDDLFAGVLLPYAEAAAQNGVGAPPAAVSSAAPASASSPAQACASSQPTLGGVSIDAIAKAVHPTPDQSAKFDALKTAEANAEKALVASCAATVPTTAEGRLAAVETRLQAMVQAADAVRGPLDDFYSSLNDEQKAAFNALGDGGKAPTSLAQLCGPQNAVPVVATDEIDKAVQPDAKQQASLAALNDAANKADQAILASCPAQAPLTPPGRLDAMGDRLQAMLKGVALVKPALHDFYDSLTPAQKASFDSLTLPPPAALDSAAARP